LTGDACPTDKNIKFLPYAGPKEFYSEYVAYCKLENLLDSEYAKRETFRKGLHELRHEFRLMGAKGSFPTCEMCNNANDLLRNLKVKDQSHREIIFKLKKEHLLQQMNERMYMERNRIESTMEYDNQPVQLFILADAMTHSRGNTPQIGKQFRQSKGEINSAISNRVMGKS
jgi:hypothetical protein